MNAYVEFRPEEQRKFPRKNATGIITLTPGNGARGYAGKMFNFSEGGMGLATDVPLNIMSQVHIEVAQSSDLPRSKRFKGRVVWSRNIHDLDSGTYRYGIRFVEPA